MMIDSSYNLLNKYKKNYYSQYGEDGIIEYLLDIIPNVPKICCEFGALDGQNLSNTYQLYKEKGFFSILIESDIKSFKKLQDTFGNNSNCKLFNIEIKPSGQSSLDMIFKKNDLPNKIGVLSIDVDSFDYWVFKRLELITSAILIVEFNNTIPVDVDYYDEENDVALRCSAKALVRLGKEKGYKAVACTTTNVIFIHEDHISDQINAKLPDLPIEALFDYEGQRKNNTYPIFPVYSQAVSSYPIFSVKPSLDIKLLVYAKQFFKFLILHKEKFKKPSKKNFEKIKKSGLFI